MELLWISHLITICIMVTSVPLLMSHRCPQSCRCESHKAVCKDQKNLSTIPAFPPQITYLLFQGNFLQNITKDTFTNIHNISTLILVDNFIQNISENAFEDLFNLTSVSIAHETFVTPEMFSRIFKHFPRAVRMVRISHMHWDTLPSLEGLVNSSIDTFAFRENNLRKLNGSVFRYLKKLKSLDLSYNGLTNEMCDFKGLQNISKLWLSGNWMTSVPDFCLNQMPTLRYLHMQNNKITTFSPKVNAFKCLNELQYLNLNGHAIRKLYDNAFSRLPRLRTLSIRRLAGQFMSIDPLAFNSSSLEQLYLTKNNFNFKADTVNITQIFSNCPRLKSLDLSTNALDGLNGSEFLQMIGSLKQLEKLEIMNVKFTHLPNGLVRSLPSLRTLNASHNEIISWNGLEVFSGSSSLKEIDLSHNYIQKITETTFPEWIRGNLSTLLLYNNTLSCNCEDMQWFLSWLSKEENAKKLQLHKYSPWYFCSSPDVLRGKLLIDLTYDIICPIDRMFINILISCASMIAFVLFILCVLYKARWHIRYGLFKLTKQKRQKQGYTKIPSDNFLYDCLPVYADEDIKFVKNEMIPVLEGKHDLKLCIRDRDFQLGNVFVDSIIDNIDNSRKVILILSNNFARCQWCEFQMNAVIYRMLEEQTNVIIVVMLEEISYKYFTNSLRTLVTTVPYIQWPGEEHVTNMFWENILNAFPPRPRNALCNGHFSYEEFEDRLSPN